MKIRSLALQAGQVMDHLNGEIYDSGDSLAIKTPSRPTYYWGNYLSMPAPPQPSDFSRWIEQWEQEHGLRAQRGFAAIAWESEQGDVAPFLADGFNLERTSVLTANRVRLMDKVRDDRIVHSFPSEEDWSQMVDIHYGVELDGKLIAEAGIYLAGNPARFNSVATHRDFQRQAACSTLIYHMSRIALDTMEDDTLVMEADEAYHAAKIYESIGFKPTERTAKLQWYDKG